MFVAQQVEHVKQQCCAKSCISCPSRSPIHHFHIDHNASCLPPKSLHNHCFQFFFGITVVPREIQDNIYPTFWVGKQGAFWSM